MHGRYAFACMCMCRWLEEQQARFLELERNVSKVIPTLPVPDKIARRLMPYIKKIQVRRMHVYMHFASTMHAAAGAQT